MTKKNDSESAPFSEQHAPRHPYMDAFSGLGEKPISETLKRVMETHHSLISPSAVPKPKTLMEAYAIDWRILWDDMSSRPTHYTEREKDIAKRHMENQPLQPPARREELDELVIKLFEPAKNRQVRQESLKKLTDPADDAIMESDLAGKTPFEKEMTFESQGFPDDLLKII